MIELKEEIQGRYCLLLFEYQKKDSPLLLVFKSVINININFIMIIYSPISANDFSLKLFSLPSNVSINFKWSIHSNALLI